MLVMHAIAEILKREGISTLFCYPTTPIIEAAAAAGIRPVVCRQERVGVDMANGFARTVNGRPPAVFAMQYGPGAENAFSGVATAFSDSSPVLLLPLAHPRAYSRTFPLFCSSRTFESVTKSVEELILPEEIQNVMRRAFSHLKNGRRGPVMVEIPRDLVEVETGIKEIDYRKVRSATSAGNHRDIEEAARLLVDAHCPMIQAGQGVLYAEATGELLELAELLDIPTMTTVEGKSAFPEDHDLSLGAAGAVITGHGRHFLAASDLVLGLGTSFTRHFLVNPALPGRKKLIQVTNDPRDFYKSYDLELPILGDLKLVLQQLIDAIRDQISASKPSRNSTRHEVTRRRNHWLSQWHSKLNSDERPITPYRVITEFMRAVDRAGAIVTHDSGSPRDQMIPFYRSAGPRTYIGWGKSHALGTGLGLIIGAKIAAPDKFCINFMGDAAFGMVGLDFETAVRCNVPILTVVLNNSTMAIETNSMKFSHERYRTRDIGGNYANLARDLGGWSERVDNPSEIGNAFQRAQRETMNGRAALLEFVTSPETEFSFRGNTSEASGRS